MDPPFAKLLFIHKSLFLPRKKFRRNDLFVEGYNGINNRQPRSGDLFVTNVLQDLHLNSRNTALYFSSYLTRPRILYNYICTISSSDFDTNEGNE